MENMSTKSEDDFDFRSDVVCRPDSAVKILTRLRETLPKYREFSGVEAAFLIALDQRDGIVRSMREYGHIFQWDRGKVVRFVDRYRLIDLRRDVL